MIDLQIPLILYDTLSHPENYTCMTPNIFEIVFLSLILNQLSPYQQVNAVQYDSTDFEQPMKVIFCYIHTFYIWALITLPNTIHSTFHTVISNRF